jgi:hypothetical protein
MTNLKNKSINESTNGTEVLIGKERKGAKVGTVYLRGRAAPIKRTQNHKNNHHGI